MSRGTREKRRNVGIAGELRGAGLRVTRGRLAVFEMLEVLGGHRSADEVHDALVSRDVHVSRTSVYSTLEALTRAGLVMVADAGPGRALYEAGARWHHHAVCRVCSAVSDVECVVGKKPCLTASGDWGEVDEAQVIFRGVCRSCLVRGSRRTKAAPKKGHLEAFERRCSATEAVTKGNTTTTKRPTKTNRQRRSD